MRTDGEDTDMTVKTTPWQDLVPQPLVTVARVGGRTIIGNRGAIWDAEGLRPYVPTVPAVDGRYEIRGRRFAPATGDWAPTGQALYDTLAAIDGRNDTEITVTTWSYQGSRVVITAAGQVRCIPDAVADLATDAVLIRATDDPGDPLAVYRHTDDGLQLVGLVQGYSGDRDDPVMAAIAARGTYYAAT